MSTCHRTALVNSSCYFLAYQMNYPVKGVAKPPTIHKRRGIHQIPAVPSLKDNDNSDNNRTATRLLEMTAATSRGYIVRQRTLNRPHQRKTTGVDQQRLHAGHAPHHGYTLLLISASTDNGRTRIVLDNNGPKTPTTARTKSKEDTMKQMTTMTTRIEYTSPDEMR